MHDYISVFYTLTRCYSYSEVYFNRLIAYLIIHDRHSYLEATKTQRLKVVYLHKLDNNVRYLLHHSIHYMMMMVTDRALCV